MNFTKIPFNIPTNFAKEVLLNWTNHRFFLEAFNLNDAKSIKKDEITNYFFAHTKEFFVLPLYIAGKTTKKKNSVDFEFSVQRKSIKNYFSVIEKADKGIYLFKFQFENNFLTLKELTSHSSNISTIKKALEISSSGIEIQYYLQLADNLEHIEKKITYKSPIKNEKEFVENEKLLEKKESDENEDFSFKGPDYIYAAFKLLELKPTRNIKKIRYNYRILARKKHPDTVKESKLKSYAEREFIELSTAYKTILKWLES